MTIVWDEPKRLANLDKHGLDFAALDLDFFARSVIVPGKRGRFIAIGHLSRRAIVVVCSRLGREAISIISMRPASAAERKAIHG